MVRLMIASPSLSRRRLLSALPVGAAALAWGRGVAAGNEHRDDGRPELQRRFEERVFSTYWTWRRLESNELRRSQIAEERGRDLLEVMSNTTFFSEWQLIVGHIGLDESGHAWIGLMSIEKTTPRMILTNAGATAADTLRQRLPASVHSLAATLDKGDYVIASGELFHDHIDGYRELGRATGKPADVRMQYPHYCVRYTALRKAD